MFYLDDAELRRTLQSLACGKVRVLRKVPQVSAYVSFNPIGYLKRMRKYQNESKGTNYCSLNCTLKKEVFSFPSSFQS